MQQQDPNWIANLVEAARKRSAREVKVNFKGGVITHVAVLTDTATDDPLLTLMSSIRHAMATGKYGEVTLQLPRDGEIEPAVVAEKWIHAPNR